MFYNEQYGRLVQLQLTSRPWINRYLGTQYSKYFCEVFKPLKGIVFQYDTSDIDK